MKTIEESIISRYKLLMEYDTSKTLVENLTVITEAPNPFSNLIKSVSTNTIDDVIKSARGGLKNTAGKAITNADDLIKALEKNLVSAANIGKIRTGLMKSSSLKLADKVALIDDFVTNPNVYNKYKNLNQRDIVTKFKGVGYPDDVAKEIARKIRGQVGQMKKITPQIQNILKDANNQVLKAGARNWNWPRWLKWGAGLTIGAGTVYMIVQMLKDDGTLMENPEGTPETSPEDGGGSTGKFTDCKGTYTQGCKSEVIRKVQGCLNVKPDSLFGPKTQGALESKGFKNGFTDADVDKLCPANVVVQPPVVVEPPISQEDQYGYDTGNQAGAKPQFDSTVSNISVDKLDSI